VSNTEGSTKHWPEPTAWLYPCFIYHQTPFCSNTAAQTHAALDGYWSCFLSTLHWNISHTLTTPWPGKKWYIWFWA